MARTRAKPAPKESTPEPAPSSTKPLPEATANPPKLFVLPRDTSSDARIVTLDNPATEAPSRYYFCPSKGFYEFTRIAAPKKACRSWLITRQDARSTQGTTQNQPSESKEGEAEAQAGLGSGFVAKDASLFLATPIDLLFLLLPALAPSSAKEEKQLFLELDDYTDKLGASSPHWKALLAQHPPLRGMVEKKMRMLCDTVDAGDETMYRLSHTKLLAILMKKAERMVAHGLPPSMEDKFVKTPLSVPVMSIQREDSSLSAVSTPPTASQTTPESQATDLTTPDEATPPSKPTLHTPHNIPHLLRLRTALTYLATSYLPPPLATHLTTLLSSSQTPDFTPLTTHLSTLASLKAATASLRSISDNISRRRAVEIDEDKVAEREEKKRKREEENVKKKNESLGVKKLRKVDTRGMRKMSDFFGVRPKAN